MNSMTGFGRGYAEAEGRQLTVEIKSVNHRYSDVSIRAPRVMAFCEDGIKAVISSHFSRGHFDCYVTYRNLRDDSREVVVDNQLLLRYMKAFKEASKLGVKGKITPAQLLTMQDVLTVTACDDDREAIAALYNTAAEQACCQMAAMRAAEGEKIKADLLLKLANIEGFKNKIAGMTQDVSAELFKKLNARIAELLGQTPVDQQRLAQEIAISADRLSIDEELVRLQTHISNMRSYMNAAEPQGRKLDFLIQEMNREVNTIGSKVMNSDIQTEVINAKAELEKLREQIQNIE